MNKTNGQQQAAKEPITDIKLTLVGEDGNAFNEKTFVMESWRLFPSSFQGIFKYALCI